MTRRNGELYIKDILDSIEKIEAYTKGLSFNEFSRNKMAIDVDNQSKYFNWKG